MSDPITIDPETMALIKENRELMRIESPSSRSLWDLPAEMQLKIIGECLAHAESCHFPVQGLSMVTRWPLRPDFPLFPSILYPICRTIRGEVEAQRRFAKNQGRDHIQEERALFSKYWDPKIVNNTPTWQFDVPVQDGTSVQFFFFPWADLQPCTPSRPTTGASYFQHVEFRHTRGHSRETILTFDYDIPEEKFVPMVSGEAYRFIEDLAQATAGLEDLWDGGLRAPIRLQPMCKAALGVCVLAVGVLMKGGSREGQFRVNKYRTKERKIKRARNGEEEGT